MERLCRLLESPIDLASRLGSGSVFRVHLPRVRAQDQKVPAPTPLAPVQTSLQLRLVCVDNEPAILEAMQALLGGWGCRIECARNRRQALQLARPDLLLMDFHLEDGHLEDSVDGIALAQELMAHWGGPVPCVIISAENTDLVRNRARGHGWQFLQKPLRPAALRALLQQYARPLPATKVV